MSNKSVSNSSVPAKNSLQMMAVLSESLLYCTQGPLRMQALSAWLCFVQLLAKHAPHVLERIAAQAAVVLLPVLEPADTQVIKLRLILCHVEHCTSKCSVGLAGM
jgi:hypothetical protein